MGDHSEAIEIAYDPRVVSYEELLEVFWREHDSTHPPYSIQYRSAIFVHDEEQRRVAQASLARAEKQRGARVYTAIEKAGRFTDAEDYHQKYMLRSRRELVSWLEDHYGNPAWTRSTLAARLSGFVGGDATRAEVVETAGSLGLDAALITGLDRIMERAERR